MTGGLYLVLEGGDASGKTHHARLLEEWLCAAGHAVCHLREPGSTPAGEALRRVLLSRDTGELAPVTEALLFSAARAEMLRVEVAPALETGAVVLVERCYLSTLVYQGVAGNLSLEFLRQVTAAVHGDLWPDRIFVLDVDEETRRGRATAVDKSDRIEVRGDGFHAAVRQGYLDVAATDPRVEVVDARAAIVEVQDSLRGRIAGMLREASA